MAYAAASITHSMLSPMPSLAVLRKTKGKSLCGLVEWPLRVALQVWGFGCASDSLCNVVPFTHLLWLPTRLGKKCLKAKFLEVLFLVTHDFKSFFVLCLTLPLFPSELISFSQKRINSSSKPCIFLACLHLPPRPLKRQRKRKKMEACDMVANIVTTFPHSLFLHLEEVTLATTNPCLCYRANFIFPHYYFISVGWLLTDFLKNLIFLLKFIWDFPPPISEYLKAQLKKPTGSLEVESCCNGLVSKVLSMQAAQEPSCSLETLGFVSDCNSVI